MFAAIFEIVFTLLKFIAFCAFGFLKAIIPLALQRKKSVRNKVVLVTGAGHGIGREIALNFARAGANLVLWDIDISGNEETARLVEELNVKAYTYTCDVRKREIVYKVAEDVKREVGHVSVLVNNAGIVAGKYFLDVKDEEVIRTMEVNTMAHFWTLKAFLPDMVRANEGHVVTIASILGETGLAGVPEYTASKFAVRGLHDTILKEMHVIKSDVKCTVVCPYGVSSGMFEGIHTRFEFLLPFMTVEYVGKKTVQAVLTDTEVLYLPPHIQALVFLRTILPTPALLELEDALNLNEAMKTFVGRNRGEMKKET